MYAVVRELPGAFIPFLLTTLFVTIAVLAEERVFNVFTSSKAFYIIGCCHGLAVACLLVNDSVMSITNTTDHTALEAFWQFLASYSLCVVLCNAVFNWSRNLPATASKARTRYQEIVIWIEVFFVFFSFPFGKKLFAKWLTTVKPIKSSFSFRDFKT